METKFFKIGDRYLNPASIVLAQYKDAVAAVPAAAPSPSSQASRLGYPGPPSKPAEAAVLTVVTTIGREILFHGPEASALKQLLDDRLVG